MNDHKAKDRTHPSYGMIRFSRQMSSHARRLFGSALKTHYATISMTVSRGVWQHDLHEDRYYAADELIEVTLSAAQFAEAITSMNMGSGTPCTIERVNQEFVEDPPAIETEVERIKSAFGEDLQNMVSKMREYRKEVETLSAKLPEKARERMRIALDVMVQQLASNVPFIMEQFNEASDRVVTAAKHDIEAFAMHAIHTAGLDAIAADREQKQLQLVDGDKEKNP